ncbi:hypothetical protein BU23DRAFT_561405 [Bimuria novae-zelandiae CBS 107.79]|uniref:Fungal N-terminal domain-containing protein n=1 Tax=Bimuria novae-zelandiae CBS 107.79 TaxID=1447943 RepID=A0A6A5UIP8_9PLEO|nr:hypothetical protein BU23DRAFT_561405 [Bimuria novae-zelandiae CBS 107.79]
MEAAAAVVGFIGLAGHVAQSLKSLYDFTTNMKDCPKDIREMKSHLVLVEYVITQVIRQCNDRDVRLRESAALARAIGRAQGNVEDLKELLAYLVDGKHKRFSFAAKFRHTQKLRESLDRTMTTMFGLNQQLQSDLIYDIRDTNREILRSVEKTNRNLETCDRSLHKVAQQSEVQHITDLLTETRISPSPTSIPSTPTLSREVSDISVIKSSQETTATSISSSSSIPLSVSQNARQADIVSRHPLLQFKGNQFQFLVALIFIQRTNKQCLACQRASECLVAYPTSEALSRASSEALSAYFGGIGLQNTKPLQLTKLAQAYLKDPPKQGRLRSKAKNPQCPQSEISHLPQIGQMSVNAWLVYCCERTDVVTDDKPLLEYMEYVAVSRALSGQYAVEKIARLN